MRTPQTATTRSRDKHHDNAAGREVALYWKAPLIFAYSSVSRKL